MRFVCKGRGNVILENSLSNQLLLPSSESGKGNLWHGCCVFKNLGLIAPWHWSWTKCPRTKQINPPPVHGLLPDHASGNWHSKPIFGTWAVFSGSWSLFPLPSMDYISPESEVLSIGGKPEGVLGVGFLPEGVVPHMTRRESRCNFWPGIRTRG